MEEDHISLLWRMSIDELEAMYQANQHDRSVLLRPRDVLKDRDTKKAKELNGKVGEQLKFFDGVATGLAAAQATKTPPYRRNGVHFLIMGTVSATLLYVFKEFFMALAFSYGIRSGVRSRMSASGWELYERVGYHSAAANDNASRRGKSGTKNKHEDGHVEG